MPLQDFYLVWSPTGSAPPTKRHATFQQASDEAVRLARACRGGAEFYVMRVLRRVRLTDIEIADVEFRDDIPF